MTSLRATSKLCLILAGASAAVVVTAARPAQAHFTLEEPASWMSQDALGAPEKLGPCGDEGGGTPTNKVTAFQKGDTITITIDENIFHPGHYRVALAQKADRSDLPPEPTVTPGGGTPCGSVPIQDPPIFPVLADGLLVHTQPFSGPQTVMVKLPPNVTCDHCTLQVIEFMSNHGLNMPGGCFYHHCADIRVSSVVVDGGPSGGGGGGTTTTTTEGTGGSATTGKPTTNGAGGAGGSGGAESSSSSCGCATPGGTTSAMAGLVGLGFLAAFARRRRRS